MDVCRNAIRSSGFSCHSCRRKFSNRGDYVDLTILDGTRVYDENTTAGAEIFRSPVVSFVYERGWRQNFARAGFPGPDEEVIFLHNFIIDMNLRPFYIICCRGCKSSILCLAVDMCTVQDGSELFQIGSRRCHPRRQLWKRVIHQAVCSEWRLLVCYCSRLFREHAPPV